MPQLLNRRGLGLWLWPCGEITAFETFAQAQAELEALALQIEACGQILANLV
jgi:hypothetical protein